MALLGVLTFSGVSGTWTESGNGEVGSGFCDAMAPEPKLALVGVIASSMIATAGLVSAASRGAALGLGVGGAARVSSLLDVGAGDNGMLTGWKVAAMGRMFVLLAVPGCRKLNFENRSQTNKERRLPLNYGKGEGRRGVDSPVRLTQVEVRCCDRGKCGEGRRRECVVQCSTVQWSAVRFEKD